MVFLVERAVPARLKRTGTARSTLGQFPTREIARAHGGTPELEDSAADQTVFCLTLPAG